jgi:hypothetical protein
MAMGRADIGKRGGRVRPVVVVEVNEASKCDSEILSSSLSSHRQFSDGAQ